MKLLKKILYIMEIYFIKLLKEIINIKIILKIEIDNKSYYYNLFNIFIKQIVYIKFINDT